MTTAHPEPERPSSTHPTGSAAEVFRAFLKLGLTSFGGPVAHLGYFRDELVIRRRWVRDSEYADLVALGQFLPGPASSQVGFALGLFRAGPLGGLAAWAAFMLPSAILMVAFAFGAALFAGWIGAGVLAGLKIVAVAIVAQAVWGMARTLTPDARRAGIALGAALIALFAPGSLGQVAAIVAGAAAGWALCRGEPSRTAASTTADTASTTNTATASTPATAQAGGLALPIGRRAGVAALVTFGVLFAALPLAAASGAVWAQVADAFYRAGALVFGGGHVVLPLLQADAAVSGWVAPEQFLAGYGAAQAVPGPLFTFAAYLGAFAAPGPAGIATAAIALVAVFLPGLLLMAGVLPFWNALRTKPRAQAVMRGANAAVVGILAVALYDPIFLTSIVDPASFALALVCFVLLVSWRTPPWVVVLVGAAGGVLIALTQLA